MSENNEYALVAPVYERNFGFLLDKSRLEVLRLCKEHGFHTLLDVGCGTGKQGSMAISQDLTFMGVDQSPSMLAQARLNLPKGTYLQDSSATSFADEFLSHNAIVDVALCSLILHEMSYSSRLQVIEQVRRCARNLIIMEYFSPKHAITAPMYFLVNIAEFLAGKRNYTCYRDFMKRGGIEGILSEMNLPVIAQSTSLNTIRIVLTSFS